MEQKEEDKLLAKQKKERMKMEKTIKELKQQIVAKDNKISALSYSKDKDRRTDRMQNEYTLEQIAVQQRKLEEKLRKLNRKEADLESKERRNMKAGDLHRNKQKMSLQQQQELDAAEKRFNVQKQLEMAELRKQRLDLERQQKLLEMNNKYKSKRNRKTSDDKLSRFVLLLFSFLFLHQNAH